MAWWVILFFRFGLVCVMCVWYLAGSVTRPQQRCWPRLRPHSPEWARACFRWAVARPGRFLAWRVIWGIGRLLVWCSGELTRTHPAWCPSSSSGLKLIQHLSAGVGSREESRSGRIQTDPAEEMTRPRNRPLTTAGNRPGPRWCLV